jgi:hypothetical protein
VSATQKIGWVPNLNYCAPSWRISELISKRNALLWRYPHTPPHRGDTLLSLKSLVGTGFTRVCSSSLDCRLPSVARRVRLRLRSRSGLGQPRELLARLPKSGGLAQRNGFTRKKFTSRSENKLSQVKGFFLTLLCSKRNERVKD